MGNIELTLGVADHSAPVTLDSFTGSPSLNELHDSTHYLFDTLYSLHSLLKIFPPAIEVVHECDFEIRLATSYDKVIPTLSEEITELSQYEENYTWTKTLLDKLKILRSIALSTFRMVIENVSLNNLQNNTSHDKIGSSMERFIQTMSSCVGERRFIVDYNSIYPISKDLKKFEEFGGDVASVRFIEEAVNTVVEEMKSPEDLDIDFNLQEDSTQKSGMNGYLEVDDIELASLVTSILDLFPDLGAGFIEECLKYFNNSTEDVINSLLEDKLPPHLRELDRSLPLQPKNVVSNNEEPKVNNETKPSELLSSRANVYDNDSLDVFNSEFIDVTGIHKGKKNKNKVLNEENSIDFSSKMKEIVNKYEERKGTSIYEDELAYTSQFGENDYEDEYDDTYDDQIAALEPTDIDRIPTIRGKGSLNHYLPASDSETEENFDKFNHRNNHLSNSSSRSRESSCKDNSSSERLGRNDNEDTRPKLSFQPFCENPELIRQRKEQRRLERDQMRNRGRGRFGGTAPTKTETNNESSFDSNSDRVRYSSHKNSGKSWRDTGSTDGEGHGSRGGKYKEASNTHGKAQNRTYRNKMVHKNEQRRQGAQAKFNRNN